VGFLVGLCLLMELSLEENAGSQQVKLANLGCQDTLTLFGVLAAARPSA
jgi:hypothetical protein